MNTYFERTEDGVTENVTARVALDEVNRCMMSGKSEVRTMSGGWGLYSIEYKDGRKVKLNRVEGDMPGSVGHAIWNAALDIVNGVNR